MGQIGLLCGYYQMSPPVESRSSALIIEFITDDINSVLFTGDNTNSASGFNISYFIIQRAFQITGML